MHGHCFRFGLFQQGMLASWHSLLSVLSDILSGCGWWFTAWCRVRKSVGEFPEPWLDCILQYHTCVQICFTQCFGWICRKRFRITTLFNPQDESPVVEWHVLDSLLRRARQRTHLLKMESSYLSVNWLWLDFGNTNRHFIAKYRCSPQRLKGLIVIMFHMWPTYVSSLYMYIEAPLNI